MFFVVVCILTSGFYRRRSQVIERFECHDTVDTPEEMDTANSTTEPAPSYSSTANQRAGRNERRLSNQKQVLYNVVLFIVLISDHNSLYTLFSVDSDM